MKLAQLLAEPGRSLVYLERYVNQGSPSGFSETWTTSPETSPLLGTDTFRLALLRGEDSNVVNIGQAIGVGNIPPDCVLVHPDVAKQLPAIEETPYGIDVSPTASGRTVHVHAPKPFHVKLHYDAIVGRRERSLGLREALYAVYATKLIEEHVSSNRLTEPFGILPEAAARVITRAGETEREIGMVIRGLEPACRGTRPIAIVPGFAMFSPDRGSPADPPLIVQMIQTSNMRAEALLLNKLLTPLVDCYFDLLRTLGFQAEFHAQNILFGVDENGLPSHVLLRDMEAMHTDADLRLELGLRLPKSPVTHRSIFRSQYNYQIKHSFMFDFKLGEYLLSPLIDALAAVGVISRERMESAIREHVNTALRDLPEDFLPPDCWYSVKRVQIDRSTEQRPYERHANPRFRTAMTL